ncbi:hypothetical protein [Hahella ganghwensis]|uniref:hypothetical protein n=1 Tax=Hahella ganghwensis TaxID=286420 RepID=UPI0003771222|nr:hypothetical protein [Hahella ganghwensis]
MPTREQVRQAVKDTVALSYSGNTYTSRRSDTRNDKEFVQVFVAQGDVEPVMGLTFSTEALLYVSYYKQLADDSDLDTVADQIRTSILTDSTLRSVLGAIAYAGYEYGDLDDGTPGITHRFTIKYSD